MITYLKKNKITEDLIIYNYGSNKEKIDGTVNVLRSKLDISPEFIPASGDKSLYFARQAMFAIVKFIRENKFPDEFIRAIG